MAATCCCGVVRLGLAGHSATVAASHCAGKGPSTSSAPPAAASGLRRALVLLGSAGLSAALLAAPGLAATAATPLPPPPLGLAVSPLAVPVQGSATARSSVERILAEQLARRSALEHQPLSSTLEIVPVVIRFRDMSSEELVDVFEQLLRAQQLTAPAVRPLDEGVLGKSATAADKPRDAEPSSRAAVEAGKAKADMPAEPARPRRTAGEEGRLSGSGPLMGVGNGEEEGPTKQRVTEEAGKVTTADSRAEGTASLDNDGAENEKADATGRLWHEWSEQTSLAEDLAARRGSSAPTLQASWPVGVAGRSLLEDMGANVRSGAWQLGGAAVLALGWLGDAWELIGGAESLDAEDLDFRRARIRRAVALVGTILGVFAALFLAAYVLLERLSRQRAADQLPAQQSRVTTVAATKADAAGRSASVKDSGEDRALLAWPLRGLRPEQLMPWSSAEPSGVDRRMPLPLDDGSTSTRKGGSRTQGPPSLFGSSNDARGLPAWGPSRLLDQVKRLWQSQPDVQEPVTMTVIEGRRRSAERAAFAAEEDSVDEIIWKRPARGSLRLDNDEELWWHRSPAEEAPELPSHLGQRKHGLAPHGRHIELESSRRPKHASFDKLDLAAHDQPRASESEGKLTESYIGEQDSLHHQGRSSYTAQKETTYVPRLRQDWSSAMLDQFWHQDTLWVRDQDGVYSRQSSVSRR
eukprot:SM000333S12553  [mRNA]  locus=s333:29908:32438:+ [translate_table: standard]